VVCLQLSNHSAASPEVAQDACSKRRRIRVRLRFGNEGGQSLVEFALCLPPLFILLTGFVALGIAFINYNQLNNAANSASTLLSLSRAALAAPNYDPCALVVTQVEATAPTLKPA
jgi:Flp pilus assembly protein TadG